MSDASISYLATLPVEILHRIFDNLDLLTIILSLRITCRRLKAIADDYDRYRFDFRFVSRSDFQLLCHLIDPRKVTSLTLAPTDETLDQTELFITCFRARRFKRLRSLTLININENQLKVLLKRFDCSSLTSFTLRVGRRDYRCRSTVVSLVSSIIAQANLHYLDIDISHFHVEKLAWPAQCGIRNLKIKHLVEGNQLLTILRCLPHLQTLNMKFFSSANPTIIQNSSSSTLFPQITSAILEEVRVDINYLELLISLMPSLNYLKVTGLRDLMNGNRWEQFIQTNLPFLNQFELFVEIDPREDTQMNIKSIIASFQTPFWVEHKKWYFTCEHRRRVGEYFLLYSLPFCASSLTYLPESKRTSLSNYNPLLIMHVSAMDNVKTLTLSSKDFTSNDMDLLLENQLTSSNAIFRKVTKLELHYDTNRILNWIPYILALIDLKTVVEIKLTGTNISHAEPNIIADMSNLLQQACNLTSIDVCYHHNGSWSALTAREICAMTPSHVKHLTTSLKNLNEVKIALERLQSLSTARLSYGFKRSEENSMVEWFGQNKSNSIHDGYTGFIKIWFGHNNIQSTRAETRTKRTKLTDEHYNS